MSDELLRVLVWGGVVVGALLLVRVFSAPIRLGVKLLFNTVLGLIGLVVFNFFGAYLGISLGINLFNGVTVGVFGLPGLAALLFLRWISIT